MYKYLTPVSVPHLISPRVPGSPALTGAVMGPVLATLKPLVIPILLPVIFTSLPTPFGCMLTFCPVTGNVDILSSGELTVDSITSNAGSGLVILPATGQNVNIQPNGVGSEVNITGSNIGITSGFKVANTGPMTAPVNAGDPGTLGDIRWGTDTGVRYLYICIAANTWERVALAPW